MPLTFDDLRTANALSHARLKGTNLSVAFGEEFFIASARSAIDALARNIKAEDQGRALGTAVVALDHLARMNNLELGECVMQYFNFAAKTQQMGLALSRRGVEYPQVAVEAPKKDAPG